MPKKVLLIPERGGHCIAVVGFIGTQQSNGTGVSAIAPHILLASINHHLQYSNDNCLDLQRIVAM